MGRLGRETETVRQVGTDAQLVPALRVRRGTDATEAALRPIEARAIIHAVERAVAEWEVRIDPGVGDQLIEQGADKADVQRPRARELVVVGRVEVEALGLQAADVLRL